MEGPSGEVRGFQRLYEFSRRVLAEEHPEGLVERLVDALRYALDASCVILFRVDAGKGEEIWSCSRDEELEGLGETSYSRTLVSAVIDSGCPLLIQDVPQDPQFCDALSIRALELTSALGAPLFLDGELAGILYATRHRFTDNFKEYHRDLMTVAAAQAGLLLRHVKDQDALCESHRRLQSLLEVSPTAIIVLSTEGVLFSNRAAQRLWRTSGEACLEGKAVVDLFEGWRSERLLGALSEKNSFDSLEAWVRPLEGEEGKSANLVEVWGEPILYNGHEAMQLALSAVGEKRIGIARKARADRLAAMGAMAATVGHEINNPLAYVHANLEFAQELLEPALNKGIGEIDFGALKSVLEGMRAALEGTERIRAVVSSIQSFSRLGESEDSCSDIIQPLQSSLRLAMNELSADVDLQVDLRPTNPVGLDPSRLGQIFLNLLINAAQALREVPAERGRRLEVRCRQVEGEVIIEIADNGPGIDPKIKEQLFQPFVTTKATREGTGLGLAIAHEIVESVNGRIEVESESGEGALFRVILPAREEPSTSSFEVVDEEGDVPRGRILIVDPDPVLATSLCRLLAPLHDAEAVTTLGEAVEYLSSVREVDVILCDLRLRGGVGLNLLQWMEKNAPQYWERTLAMTASLMSHSEQDYLDSLPNGWVGKPFDKVHLRNRIAKILLKSCEVQEEASGSNR